MARSILIVKTSAIGDVAASFDTLSYLRRRFPDASIDWVVERASFDLLQAHPHVNRLFLFDSKKWRKAPLQKENREELFSFLRELRKKRYDLLFDLQGNTKSAFVTGFARAREKVGYSFSCVPEKPNLLVTHKKIFVSKSEEIRRRYLLLAQNYFQDKDPFVTERVSLLLNEEEREELEKIKNLCPKRPLFMICFGSNWENKRLPDVLLEKFLQRVVQQFTPFLLFSYGNPVEETLAQAWEQKFPNNSMRVGGLSLPLWQSAIGHMDCVITMDSAALHLAHTAATPAFSFFGPSSSSVYNPPGELYKAVQGNCPYGEQFVSRCSKLRNCPTGACISRFQPDALAEEFAQWFKSVRAEILR